MKTTFITHEGLELEQLGTFAHYINNVQFRFVITRESPLLPIVVTHRQSGKRVCAVTHTAQQAALGDIVGAARLCLRHLIESKGSDRVYVVLRQAE